MSEPAPHPPIRLKPALTPPELKDFHGATVLDEHKPIGHLSILAVGAAGMMILIGIGIAGWLLHFNR